MTDAIVRNPWYLCGGPFRRGMLMFMASSMKPAVLTGGKFFVLDYDKMKAVSGVVGIKPKNCVSNCSVAFIFSRL